MNLRTKLFISIGALLIFLSLIMYFMPYFLVEEDVNNASTELKELARNEEIELMKSQKILLERQLDEIEANVDSLLYLISDSSDLKAAFSLQNSATSIWETFANFLAYDPSIGLLQVTDLADNQSFVLVSSKIPFYHFHKTELFKDVFLVILDEETFHLGISIEDDSQSLLLFSLQDFWEKGKEQKNDTIGKKIYQAHVELEKKLGINASYVGKDLFIRTLLDTYLPKEKLSQGQDSLPSPYIKREQLDRTEWATSVQMIQTLAPYYGASLNKNPSLIPIGLAQVDVLNRPLAILSEDVFRNQPLYNDVEYFEKNSKENEAIANERALIQDPKSGIFYLANALHLTSHDKKGTIVTIGTHLYSFIRSLALSSGRMIVLMVNNQVDLGFNDQGAELQKKDLEGFEESLKKTSSESNQFPFLGKSYRIFQISLLPKWDLTFFILTPKEKERMLEMTLLKLNQAVSTRISYHILLVALGSLILALIILGRISLNITKPIAKLAKATEQVVKGNYTEIDLPTVKNRHDEVAVLTHSFEQMVKGLNEKEKIRGVLNKVVSKEVADLILKTSIHLGGEDRVVTMLFSDIRGFTKTTENLAPQVVISMLNTYMTKMSRVIEGEGGVIDKYVGDEIMALYGAPAPHPDHAVRAISSAILMVEALKKWNKEREQQKLPLLQMGVGIHTGLVVAGNMGAEDRLNYTVLGSSVNLASRLCGIANPMQIIVSESTFLEENVQSYFKFESLPPVHLKGFTEQINIYQINGFQWE